MLVSNFLVSQTKNRPRSVYGQYSAHKNLQTGQIEHHIFPPASPVNAGQRSRYSHIRTIVTHGQSQTLIAIPFDLDADKAQGVWKNADGSLNHTLIVRRLRAVMPELEAVPFKVMRSRSGLGLGLLIMINPLNITKADGSRNEERYGLYQRFTQIQGLLSHIMEKEGMGADPAAKGLNRYVPNWKNQDNLLLEENSKEKFNRRTCLNLQETLTKALKTYAKYERLYRDERCEKKLIPLFEELHAATLSGAAYIIKSMEDLRDEYGLSAPTVRKILISGKGTPWLSSERLAGRDYKLSLSGSYSDWEVWLGRCEELQKQVEEKERPGAPYNAKANLQVLCPPKNVVDGRRNHWLWSLAILIASEIDGVWTGSGAKKVYQPHGDAHRLFQRIALEIPGARSSRNCTANSLRKVLNWAYESSPRYAKRERIYPEWLLKKINSYRSNTVADDLNRGPCGGFGASQAEEKVEDNSRISSLWRYRVGTHCHALYSFDGENYTLQGLLRDARSFMQPWLKKYLKKHFATDEVLKLPTYALGVGEIQDIQNKLAARGVFALRNLPQNYFFFESGGQGEQRKEEEVERNEVEDEIIILAAEEVKGEELGDTENLTSPEKIFNVFKPHLEQFRSVQVSFDVGREMNRYDLLKLQNAISCGLTPWALSLFVERKALHFREKGFKFYSSLEKILAQMKEYEVYGQFEKEDRELFWRHYLDYLPVMEWVHRKLNRYGSSKDCEFFLRWMKITKGKSDFMMVLVKKAFQEFEIKSVTVLEQRMCEIKGRGY